MTDDRTQSADRSELRAPGTSRLPVRHGAPDIPHTEEALDRLVHLACRILGAERVVVTLPGEHRQLVEGCKGVEAALTSPSEHAFIHRLSTSVLESGAPCAVSNARIDGENALSTSEAVAYAGVPLTLADGRRVGCLGVVDAATRQWSVDDVRTLQELAASFMNEIDLRKTALTAQRQVAAEEARFRQLVATTFEGVWTIDRDSRTTFVNARMAAMLGYSIEEMLGQPFFDFMDEEARAEAEKNLERRKKLVHEQHEFRLRRRDGADLWTLMASSPILDDNGRYDGALAMVSDITEQKYTLQALRQSEEAHRRSTSLLRATLESTADGILVVDTEGRIVSYNRKFSELWRIPDAILDARDDRAALACVLHQLQNPERFQAKVQELYREREAVSFDVLTFKDGRIFERYSQPHRIGGQSVGRVWSFRDVTERYRLAEQIGHLQKMQAVGRLASGVAHDFNNLLTVVNTYADMMLGSLELSYQRRGDAEQIKQAANRASSLARQLVAFSRQQQLRPRSLDLAETVRALRPLLDRLLRPGITLIAEPAAAARQVFADPGQLERVLVNLVVNAVDAMPMGGTLRIRIANAEVEEPPAPAQTGARAGPHVLLEVSDSGTGMDAETLSHIFEPFFTTKPAGEGTGLGLATVYGIVEQSGGHVRVLSEVNRGTTFRIYLPATQRE